MAGVLKVTVDQPKGRAVVRFDPEKLEVSKIVAKIDATRFTASLDAPVARVYESKQVEVRAVPDKQEYDGGAEGKVNVSITPAKGVELTDLVVRSGFSWTKKGGEATISQPITKRYEVPIAFEAPKKAGEKPPEVTVELSYQVDGKDSTVKLTVQL